MNNKTWIKVLAATISLGMIASAHAGSREQALRIHERLTGVPPTAAELNSMEAMIDANNATGAANMAWKIRPRWHFLAASTIYPRDHTAISL